MNLTWLANTSQGRMVGDYISSSFSNGVVFPIFAVASAPVGTTFQESMFTVSTGLTIASGTLLASSDGVVVTTHHVPTSANAR